MEIIKKPKFISGSLIVFAGIAVGVFFNSIIKDYPEWSNMFRLLNEVKIPIVMMFILLGTWFIWLSAKRDKKNDWLVVAGFLVLFIIFTILFIVAII